MSVVLSTNAKFIFRGVITFTMKKFEIIETYLENNLNTKSSRKNYRWSITKFFTIINKDPETYFDGNKEYNDYLSDMMLFTSSLTRYAPKTIHLAIAGVKSFLIENDVEFKQKDLRKFGKKCNGNKAISYDKIPTSEELQIILANASLRYKTAYLFMLSSGVRRGELCQLQLDDIDMDSNPVRVRIRASYTKSKEQRITFISNEAKKYLQQWLKQRDKYLETTYNRLKDQPLIHKDRNDNRLFPWGGGALQIAFVRLLDQVGMNDVDPVTKRHVFHTHCFRKYFRTELAQVIPLDVVETLMGHSGYLTDAYRDYSEKQLAEHYLKGMPVLEIYSTGITKTQLDDKDAIIRHLQETMEARDKAHEKQIANIFKRVKGIPVIMLEQQAQFKKDIDEGNIKELPELTNVDKRKILKDMAKD